jgi:two-component system, OmpR family, sensor kinase
LLRDTPDPAIKEKRIAAMERDLEELKDLVSELLSLNRLEQAPLLQQVELSIVDLLQSCADDLADLRRGKALKLEVASDMHRTSGDPKLLARAVNNLLTNALKYANHEVVLTARPLDTGHWQLIVDDDGPGVPEAECNNIFEPFHRLSREQDHALTGYGLGLSIAHKAVTAHGGRIDVGTSHLGGARFTVTLPF